MLPEMTTNWDDSYRLQWASASELDYHPLLARDLEVMKILDYQRLSSEVIEIKRC
jgi:hypothetical protein